MIESIFYLTITLIILFISSRLYIFSSNSSIFNLNIIHFSFWILILIAVIPSLITIMKVPLFNHNPLENPGVLGEWGGREIHVKAYLIIMWSMIAIPIGALICKLFVTKIFNITYINPLSIQEKFQTSQAEEIRDKRVSIVFIIFSFILLIQLISYGQSPLLIILNGGDLQEILFNRSEYSSNIGIFNTIFSSDTVAFFMIFTGILAYRLNSGFYWNILIIQFFIYVFLSVLGGSTGNIVFGLISLLILKNVITGKHLSIRAILFFFILVASVFYIFKAQSIESINEVVDYFFSRIIFTQIRGFYFALQLFPDQIPFLYFDTAGHWIHNIFSSNSSLDYGHLLMNEFDPIGVESGVAGHFTSVFYAEMWTNFGYYGVIFGPIWVGFIIFLVHVLVIKKNMSNLRLSIYIWLTFNGFGYLDAFIIYFYPVNIITKLIGMMIAYLVTLLITAFFNKGKITLSNKNSNG